MIEKRVKKESVKREMGRVRKRPFSFLIKTVLAGVSGSADVARTNRQFIGVPSFLFERCGGRGNH
jgi:hypothetical protein